MEHTYIDYHGISSGQGNATARHPISTDSIERILAVTTINPPRVVRTSAQDIQYSYKHKIDMTPTTI